MHSSRGSRHACEWCAYSITVTPSTGRCFGPVARAGTGWTDRGMNGRRGAVQFPPWRRGRTGRHPIAQPDHCRPSLPPTGHFVKSIASSIRSCRRTTARCRRCRLGDGEAQPPEHPAPGAGSIPANPNAPRPAHFPARAERVRRCTPRRHSTPGAHRRRRRVISDHDLPDYIPAHIRARHPTLPDARPPF